MPIMFAATIYKLVKNLDSLNIADVPVFAVGFVFSFISALIVVKIFLRYIANHDFTAFAIYRIVLGAAVLWYFR